MLRNVPSDQWNTALNPEVPPDPGNTGSNPGNTAPESRPWGVPPPPRLTSDHWPVYRRLCWEYWERQEELFRSQESSGLSDTPRFKQVKKYIKPPLPFCSLLRININNICFYFKHYYLSCFYRKFILWTFEEKINKTLFLEHIY